MGLDMYFTKSTYVKNWDFQSPEERHKITIKKGNKVRKDINPERISSIVEEVAYWRKFNALHNWFVQNCADGVDDCKKMYVDKEMIAELVDTLKEVKASLDKSPKKTIKVESGWVNGEKTYCDVEVFADTSVIEELFPTQSGFFFGSTEYDMYYYNEVVDTIKTFEEVLADEGRGDYYYQYSW